MFIVLIVLIKIHIINVNIKGSITYYGFIENNSLSFS